MMLVMMVRWQVRWVGVRILEELILHDSRARVVALLSVVVALQLLLLLLLYWGVDQVLHFADERGVCGDVLHLRLHQDVAVVDCRQKEALTGSVILHRGDLGRRSADSVNVRVILLALNEHLGESIVCHAERRRCLWLLPLLQLLIVAMNVAMNVIVVVVVKAWTLFRDH